VPLGSNAGWDALCRLLRQRHLDDRVLIKVARFRKAGSNISVDWYRVEGRGIDAAKALEAIEPPPEQHEIEQETGSTPDTTD
jgi:hypothetical protein